MSKTDLEGIIGGRKKIKVSCKLEITICYVEVNDTLKAQ